MPILYEKDQHRHVHEKLSVLHSNISRVTRWDRESGLILLLHKLNSLWRNCGTTVHMARQYTWHGSTHGTAVHMAQRYTLWNSGTHYGTVVHIMAQWYTLWHSGTHQRLWSQISSNHTQDSSSNHTQDSSRVKTMQGGY